MANRIILNNLEKSEYRRQEAFNSLRNNLKFCGADLKTFMLTSCGANDGKSTISFELARSMAESGKNVILVDADMRKSVMIKRYGMQSETKNPRGPSHYLSNQTPIEDIISETNIPGMDMILSGPASPNPTELLEGQLFEKMMEYLKERYDAVIVDTPPLGVVIDAAVMAPKCDGTILVIESEVTSYNMAIEVKKQLEMTGCRILGTVLNKVNVEKSGYYYYSYYKYYGYYK
jgi:capsular exopolysaccharide synthesis family protein